MCQRNFPIPETLADFSVTCGVPGDPWLSGDSVVTRNFFKKLILMFDVRLSMILYARNRVCVCTAATVNAANNQRARIKTRLYHVS